MKTLQIGRTYKDGQGHKYTVQTYEGEDCDKFPFKGLYKDGITFDIFTKYGKFFSYRRDSEYDLIIPDEPEQTLELPTVPIKEEPKVSHLDVILAIVQKIPVQFKNMHTNRWVDLDERHTDPVTNPSWDWRIKPQPEPKRTVQIGKRTVVAPEVEAPKHGTLVFYWDSTYCRAQVVTWSALTSHERLLDNCQLFLTEQDAINCQNAISALLLGKD